MFHLIVDFYEMIFKKVKNETESLFYLARILSQATS